MFDAAKIQKSIFLFAFFPKKFLILHPKSIICEELNITMMKEMIKKQIRFLTFMLALFCSQEHSSLVKKTASIAYLSYLQVLKYL